MNTDKPILKELNQRKSVRSFLTKEIEPEKLEALWAAAQWAPSSYNRQEWHYYAITGKFREKFAEILVSGNHWALKAPLIIAVTRDTNIENSFDNREYGVYDVALSVMSLVVEAEHQGLRTHQMAGFKADKMRDALNLSENQSPVVVVALGYEGPEENQNHAVPKKESSPRVRKPISEVVTVIT